VQWRSIVLRETIIINHSRILTKSKTTVNVFFRQSEYSFRVIVRFGRRGIASPGEIIIISGADHETHCVIMSQKIIWTRDSRNPPSYQRGNRTAKRTGLRLAINYYFIQYFLIWYTWNNNGIIQKISHSITAETARTISIISVNQFFSTLFLHHHMALSVVCVMSEIFSLRIKTA